MFKEVPTKELPKTAEMHQELPKTTELPEELSPKELTKAAEIPQELLESHNPEAPQGIPSTP